MECLILNYIIKFFEDKAKLFYVRKILVVAAAAYLLFGLFYRTYPGVSDPMGLNQRIFAASVFLTVYLLSYLMDKVKENVYTFFYYTVYFANFHLLYLAFIHEITLNYAFSIIIVNVICNLLIKAQGELKRYFIIMLIGVTFTTLYTANPGIDKFVFLAVFYVISFASFFISKLSYVNIKNVKDKEIYYKKLFEKSPIGLLKCDEDGNIIDINNHMVELSTEKSKSFFIGKNIFEMLNIDKVDLNQIDDDENFEFKVNFPFEEAIWVDYSIEKVQEGENDEYIIAFKDISNRKALEKKLSFLSFHDHMTGLYNYRYFIQELERYDKSRELPISVIIIDIDELKVINDTRGHIFGNKIIRETAEILDSAVRKEDVLARVGGDEFAIILPNTDLTTAKKVGQRINKKLEEYNNQNSEEDIQISLGWGTKEDHETSLKDILDYADLKMYDAKKPKS